ncbi:hypothetical protein [Aureimonas sp. ME7]|uniref:hypothetical protein n=1 Tax=Aureimonas sp. ME7 TaxID=2744252 RepID=UPI0015FA7A3F|nr:hypothetical protein [Aureimonas sp. ME7]
MTLERSVPNGDPVRVENVRARIRGATADEVAGGIKESERRVLILAEDVPETFRPLREGDRVLVDQLRLRFSSLPDDQSHRDGDLLLAYDGFAAS